MISIVVEKVVLIVIGRGWGVHARITSQQTDTFQALRQVDDALGRYQRAATRKAEQLTLFADLPDDRRPIYERTAAGRYQQPSLRTLPEQQADQEKT